MSKRIDMRRKREILHVDDARMHLPETGIYVRAMVDGRWVSADIAHLERASLVEWLTKSDRASQVVLLLLGHPRE